LASGYHIWRADVEYFLHCGKFSQIVLLQRQLSAQPILKASSKKVLWNDVSETYLQQFIIATLGKWWGPFHCFPESGTNTELHGLRRLKQKALFIFGQ